MGIQEKCYEWEKNWGEKPTGEQNSSQKTDDETAKKTAIDPTIDDCTVYCFFMYYWSDIFMQKKRKGPDCPGYVAQGPRPFNDREE